MDSKTSIIQQKQSFNLPDALQFKRDIPIRHLPATRTGMTVVWIEDRRCLLSSEDSNRLRTLLRDDRCSVVFYSSVTKCIKYLKRTRSREYVVVVVISHSIQVIHKIIDRLRQYRIAQTVYIVSSEENIVDRFSSAIDSISVFDDTKSMFNRLELLISDIQNGNFEGGLFTTFNRKEKALKDIGQEMGAFVWSHAIEGQ